MNTFVGMAESSLLATFLELTGLRGDLPIPAYLRLDAKLFFTNFSVFRRTTGTTGAVPASAAIAGSVAPDVAASAGPAIAGSIAPAVAAASAPAPGVARPALAASACGEAEIMKVPCTIRHSKQARQVCQAHKTSTMQKGTHTTRLVSMPPPHGHAHRHIRTDALAHS